MKDSREVKVWHSFPTEERYGLTSQLRRGAASIASNIAEACGRGTDADSARCRDMAAGSARDVEDQLLRNLALLNEPRHRDPRTASPHAGVAHSDAAG